MNMQNLASKESLGVKFKDSIYTGLCSKLWFESDWDFCNLLSHDGFERDCPEIKFQTVTLSSQFKKVILRCSGQLFPIK